MTEPESVDVSVVLTVKNEAPSLRSFLLSLGDQTLQPREVILVDGGSTDGTLDVARQWKTELPFIIVSEPGANIAKGRNVALQRASGAIVAVTDAGTRLDSIWLEEITEPFRRPEPLQPDVVAGFFVADTRNRFELALAVTTLPDVNEIRPRSFLPSSRSIAFRRSLFDAGLSYPEWLDYCEDLIFDLRLKRAGVRFEFRPSAVVAFRPRSSVVDHWKQYYRYARGDGKSGLFAKRHLARYVTYFGLLPWAVARRDRLACATVGLGAALYLRKPFQRLSRRRTNTAGSSLIYAAAAIPWLRVVGDSAKMAGYPMGLWWRWRNHGLRQSWLTIPHDTSGSLD